MGLQLHQVFKKVDNPVLSELGLGVMLFRFKGDEIGEGK